uniref:Uncharacterized protein n=1 Tax=Rhizophora mucronata TaxID=61149 RepID=A0A2P2R398_RHIMU
MCLHVNKGWSVSILVYIQTLLKNLLFSHCLIHQFGLI